MSNQILTANIHRPQVQRITRHEDSGILAITLGDNGYPGHVNVFVTDDLWDKLVVDVELFRIEERVTAKDGRK